MATEFFYPANARRGDLTRTYKNTKDEDVVVPEPYDWLEDPDSKETKEWVDQQVNLFETYIDGEKMYEECKDAMESMLNFEKYSTPYKIGNYYFYEHNTGLQDHYVLYVRKGIDGKPRVLIDPNELSEDGTTALGSTHHSEDGSLMLYNLSKSGSDWVEILGLNVESGEKLEDHLKHCKFTSVAWLHNNEGVFYTRYPETGIEDLGTETGKAENMQIWFHKLGTSQDEDTKLLEAKDLGDKNYMFGCEVTDDGKTLWIDVEESCADMNMVYTLDLTNFDSNKPLDCFKGDVKASLEGIFTEMKFQYIYLTNTGDEFYLKTNENAGNKKIIKMNFKTKETKELIPEKKSKLGGVSLSDGNKLICNYLEDVKSVVYMYNFQGEELKFPLQFQASSLGVSASLRHTEVFVSETSNITPGTIYYGDINKGDFQVWEKSNVPGWDSDEYVSKQVFYTSKDGTEIPMFLVHHKDVKPDGTNPVNLYGYGGFNISLQPSFRVSRVLFCKLFRGIYAIANLRGGGEYGETWHEMGIKTKKQNVFDDFIAAGEWLIENKYTCKEKLIIEGGSNGGLLVGACCNQRPDLFGAGVAHVGVMDMLQFHKFTIGYAWCSDFGSSDNPEEFEALYKYSPLHSIPAMDEGVQYPNFLGLTADHDDRVSPLHTMKFMAELQHKVGSNSWQKNPLLSRIEVKAGHGAGKSLSKAIVERAQIMAFLSKALKLAR